jgi:hypothetical protein
MQMIHTLNPPSSSLEKGGLVGGRFLVKPGMTRSHGDISKTQQTRKNLINESKQLLACLTLDWQLS